MFKKSSNSGARAGRKPGVVVKLSPAEAEVVSLVARGLSNGEIAQELGKSASTVKSQLGSVYRKLGIGSRIRLMVMFRS